MVVRPFVIDDLPRVVAIQNADPVMYRVSANELARDIETLPAHLAHHFLVAEVSKTIVGWTDYQHDAGSYDPRKLHVEVYVEAGHRCQGVGAALFDRVLSEMQPLGLERLRTQVRENDLPSVRFAERRGFVMTKKDFVSVLDLGGFDPSRFEPGPAGIVCLSEVDTPDLRLAWHEAFSVIRLDTPRSEPAAPISFEFFDEHVASDVDLVREATVFLVEGGEVVGFTGCFRSAEPDLAVQWLTGVRRSHRGRGLAQALKVGSITALQRMGFHRLQTDNDTTNAPMLAVNDKLGFVRQPAVLSMMLDLSS